jgi:O-antigen/teichoic acid export membrane protein
VTTVLGAKWEPATGALTILGLWVAVVQVEAALGWFLNAVGRARTNAVISAAVTVPLVPALLVGAHLAGIEGVAWVMVGSAAVAGAAMMVAVRDTGIDLSLGKQLRTLQPVVVGCALTWVVARLAVGAADGLPAPIALLLAASVGCAAYVAVIRLAWPAVWSHGVTFLRQIVAELRRGSVNAI